MNFSQDRFCGPDSIWDDPNHQISRTGSTEFREKQHPPSWGIRPGYPAGIAFDDGYLWVTSFISISVTETPAQWLPVS